MEGVAGKSGSWRIKDEIATVAALPRNDTHFIPRAWEIGKLSCKLQVASGELQVSL